MQRIPQIPVPENILGGPEAFEPPPLLRNRHVATLTAAYLRRTASSLPVTERLFEVEPGTRLVAPERGGHCAFISRNAGPERFWAESRAVEFCSRQVARRT
jgi:hypothetical protein